MITRKRYKPGTLGSPFGLDYIGPSDANGSPSSASSGPWTVRAAPGPDSDLAPDAFARALGFQTNNQLDAGLASAAFTDVLKQKIPEGESGVNAYADRGGAGMETAISHLMHSRPGATIQFPDVRTEKGGSISDASTYVPQANEVFRPSIKTSKGGPERIGEVLGAPGIYDPQVDPRYAAEQTRGTNPELASAYDKYGANFNFATGTPYETGRIHTTATPVSGADFASFFTGNPTGTTGGQSTTGGIPLAQNGQSALLQDTENTFYGGGQVAPSPTPTATPNPTQTQRPWWERLFMG